MRFCNISVCYWLCSTAFVIEDCNIISTIEILNWKKCQLSYFCFLYSSWTFGYSEQLLDPHDINLRLTVVIMVVLVTCRRRFKTYFNLCSHWPWEQPSLSWKQLPFCLCSPWEGIHEKVKCRVFMWLNSDFKSHYIVSTQSNGSCLCQDANCLVT